MIFCGTAAGAKSAEVGAYYAGPGNHFWETLYLVGLTPHRLEAQDFRQVTDYGIGLTDIAKHVSGADSTLRRKDFDADSLRLKIIRYAPDVLAFTSKRAACAFYHLKAGVKIEYGWQTNTVGQTQVYVLPSPSGAARAYWDITYWQALADSLKTNGSA